MLREGRSLPGRFRAAYTDPVTVPSLPQELVERFEPLELLGAGGMGTVVRARDRHLDRIVAVKLMQAGVPPEARDRFRREAQTLSRLRHPGVLQLYAYGVSRAGEPWLVLEYVPGESLEKRIPDPGSVPALLEVAEALDAVHAAGLVHRDVKPANILVLPDGSARLIDFGFALDPSRTALTADGFVVGTLAYMAPEVVRGGPATPAADWFGWGATLFAALEGRTPFSWDETIGYGNGGAPPQLRFGRVAPASREAALLARVLAVDPATRLQGAAAVAEVLGTRGRTTRVPSAPAEEAVRVPEVGPEPGVAPRPGPRRAMAVGLGVLCMLAAAAWRGGSGRGAPDEGKAADAPSGPVPEVRRRGTDPGSETDELLVSLVTRHGELVRGHAVDDRTVWLTTTPSLRRERDRSHVEELRARLPETGFQDAWDGYLEALLAWLQGLSDWEVRTGRRGAAFADPAVRAAFDEVVFGGGLHVLEDLRIFEDVTVVDPSSRMTSIEDLHRSAEVPAQLGFYREAVRGFRERLGPVADLPDPVLALVTAMVYLDAINAEDPDDVLGKLAGRLAGAEAPVPAYWMAKAILYALTTCQSSRAMPPARAIGLISAVEARLEGSLAWPEGPERDRIAAKLLVQEVRARRLTLEPGDPAPDGTRALAMTRRLPDLMTRRPEETRGAVRHALAAIRLPLSIYFDPRPSPPFLREVETALAAFP